MRIELLAQEADALARGVDGVGKGERFETAGLVVAGIVPQAEPSACFKRPCNVNSARQHTKDKGIARSYVDEHVVRENGRVEEDEESVLRGFDGCDEIGRASCRERA